MRFKEFINETILTTWEETPLSVKEAIEMLNEHCGDSAQLISTGNLLYRGDNKSKHAISVLDSSTGIRASRDSNNLYQLMMDASANLKDFPSRSNSLICTTDPYFASAYGDVRVIIPFNKTRIAVSASDDFLHHEINSKLIDSLTLEQLSFNLDFAVAGSLSNDDNEWYDNESDAYDRITKKVPAGRTTRRKYTDATLIDKELADPKIAERFVEFFKTEFNEDISKLVKKNPKNIFTALSTEIMTPKSLDLEMVISGDKIVSTNYKPTECWFSGKCVNMDVKLFAGIVYEMKKQKRKISKQVLKAVEIFFDSKDELKPFVAKYLKGLK